MDDVTDTCTLRYTGDELAADLAERTGLLLGELDVDPAVVGVEILGYTVARISRQAYLTSASVLDRGEAEHEAGVWRRTTADGGPEIAVCEIRRLP